MVWRILNKENQKDHELSAETCADIEKKRSEKRRAGINNSLDREYMCNMCYLFPKSPVLTLCGHIFCWGCIHEWSRAIGGCRFCPVCRSGMSIDEVISILAADAGTEDTRYPQRPTNRRRPVKAITSAGINVNGVMFGSCFLQEDESETFSYRTVLWLSIFVCAIMAILLKSYFFGS